MTASTNQPFDDDLALVRRAKEGDFAAFEALVSKYERRLFTLAHRIVGNSHDAEEVVQQSFVSVIENLESFRADSAFSTWLIRIATNHALAWLRREAIRATLSLSEDLADSNEPLPHPQVIAQWRETPEQIAQKRELREQIEDALRSLDEKYRLVFLLRDVEGLSTRETAELLGISENNVKIRLLRARLMLREQLTQLLGDERTRVPPHNHSDATEEGSAAVD